MLSKVPGFDRPKASRRSAKDRYVSRKAETMAFSFMKPVVVIFSSAMFRRRWGNGEDMGACALARTTVPLAASRGVKTERRPKRRASEKGAEIRNSWLRELREKSLAGSF